MAKFKVGDRVRVYDWKDPELRLGAKGTVFRVLAGHVAVDLDNGMLTDWFLKAQCRKLRKKNVC